jgi:hypothetical protein
MHTMLSASAIRPNPESPPPFVASRERFEGMLCLLEGKGAGELAHGELETRVEMEDRGLLRQLFQDHLDLRAQRKVRQAEVVGADEMTRTRVEREHTRALSTIFGEVRVERLGYRAPGVANLYPADAVLNLPVESTRTGCAGWRRSSPAAAPSRRRRTPSCVPVGRGWASASWSS